ncbi:GNAT family N-acetyltransferase [Roseburia intestinalis]|jgi:ABC transporter, ATP-binding protein|nr:GNAT family N-acetyltransferase [Roseburia intestinalis]
MDHFAMEEKEKHLKEIASLKQAAVRSRKWADKNEATKIGYDPVKEHDRSGATRAYIGAKTKKMQSRVTQYERRMEREIQEKEGLLQDIEQPVSLKLMPLSYHKERLISCKELSVRYEGAEDDVLKNLTFELVQGERVFLHGENGCGKSTLIKTILQQVNMRQTGYGSQDMQQTRENMQQISGGQTNIQRSGSSHANLLVTAGEICTASNLVVSYINQDTSFLRGDIRDFCRERNLEESLFFALLRQLDMERTQFEKRLEEFSEGQKRRIKMLERIENVNEQVIEKMFLLYAESMADMEREFKDRDEMEASYAAFLKEFIENPKQMVFVETAEKQWVCGLRAVESEPGKWFLEAVETMPGHRNRGYGKKLIRHVTEFLKGIGAKKIDCIIGKSNLSSIKMHSDCGFKETKEPPVNCWGELEEGRILFRLEI